MDPKVLPHNVLLNFDKWRKICESNYNILYIDQIEIEFFFFYLNKNERLTLQIFITWHEEKLMPLRKSVTF